MFVKEYHKNRQYINDHLNRGTLIYDIVTAHKASDNDDWLVAPGRCFLYDDYISTFDNIKSPQTIQFYELKQLFVSEKHRRKGIGTSLVNELIKVADGSPIILSAGIIDEKLYESFTTHDDLINYIYKEIVPFYESVGFTDVNHTAFDFEETIPMVYPKEEADRIISCIR